MSGRSAFNVLMSSAKGKVLPSKINISSSKQLSRFFSDVINYLSYVGVEWSIYYGLYKELADR